jgi:hypothetical protein
MGKGIGFGVSAAGGGSTGNTGGSSTPPGNVGTITVSGFIDPTTLAMTITVQVVAPTDPGDTITAGHLYLEVPDQSAGASFTVGTNVIGDGSTTQGPWAPIDGGIQPIAALVAGVTFTVPGPPGINASVNIASRLYVNSVSANGENKLVRANQSSPTPSQTFNLISLASGTPTSGTNVTTLTTTTGPVTIVATADSPVNVNGKLETPVVVIVANVPTGLVPIQNSSGRPGAAPKMGKWAYRLILTYAGQDPTVPGNQFVAAAGPFTQAGIVGQSTYELASADGVSEPHSFLLPTPTAVTNATVWLQAGYVDGGGLFVGNNIVPGITPSFPIVFGSTTGTTDASSIMASTIASEMAITNGLFGIATGGVSNSFLGMYAVATLNIQGLAVANPELAMLAVEAGNMASGSVTAGNAALATGSVGSLAVQNGAITNLLVANNTIDAAQIVSATITYAQIAGTTIANANMGLASIAYANIASGAIGNLQLQSASVQDANIVDLSASKLTAGTISATISITSPMISCTNGFEVTGGSITTTINNGTSGSYDVGLSITDGSTVVAMLADLSTTHAGYLLLKDTSGNNSSYGPESLQINFSTGPAAVLGPSLLQITDLPSSSPGLGSKQFYYDPSDSNRVYFAA